MVGDGSRNTGRLWDITVPSLGTLKRVLECIGCF